MVNLSETAKYLSKQFPGIAFNKEAVESLVTNDKISYEAAANLVADIDTAASHGVQSRSSESDVSPVDVDSKLEEMVGKKAVDHWFKDVKLGAMLEAIKKDDTLLYTEFVNNDKARERIMSEIVKKEEGNFNTLLNEIKTTTGTDKTLFDKLIGTSVDVTDYMSKV